MKTSFLYLILSLLLFSSACRSNKDMSPAISAMSMETVSLGSNNDGTIVVRAWGSGRNKANAIDLAKRNAVYDIVFKGIKGTNPGFAARPLVSEVNGAERYSRYFEPFFSQGGEYLKFVREEEGTAQRLKSEGLSREAYGVVLIIDRAALKAQLIHAGIIRE